MPAGVTWGKYLAFAVTSFLSMVAGAQIVHLYYKPLSDIDKYIEEEKRKLKEVKT